MESKYSLRGATMNEKNNLNQLLNMVVWEKVQEAIAEATGMAILVVDYRGVPVTSHSGCREFCKRVRGDSKFGKYCQKCDARGGLEGVITKKSYIYRCHFSIIEIAIPIIVEDNYLGAIMAGQVQLEDNNSTLKLEQILFIDNKELETKKNILNECYNKLPKFSIEKLEHTVSLLEHLCDYFVNEVKNNKNSGNLESEDKSKWSNQNISFSSNEIIEKAINYIHSTKNQNISLTEIAKYCNVSAPYLSRLFSKEMGETYSSFVSKLKVKWAKNILQNTDMTVMEISNKLGFSEPGYFIKIFKKHTNETPMNYRIHINKKIEEEYNSYLFISEVMENGLCKKLY